MLSSRRQGVLSLKREYGLDVRRMKHDESHDDEQRLQMPPEQVAPQEARTAIQAMRELGILPPGEEADGSDGTDEYPENLEEHPESVALEVHYSVPRRWIRLGGGAAPWWRPQAMQGGEWRRAGRAIPSGRMDQIVAVHQEGGQDEEVLRDEGPEDRRGEIVLPEAGQEDEAHEEATQRLSAAVRDAVPGATVGHKFTESGSLIRFRALKVAGLRRWQAQVRVGGWVVEQTGWRDFGPLFQDDDVVLLISDGERVPDELVAAPRRDDWIRWCRITTEEGEKWQRQEFVEMARLEGEGTERMWGWMDFGPVLQRGSRPREQQRGAMQAPGRRWIEQCEDASERWARMQAGERWVWQKQVRRSSERSEDLWENIGDPIDDEEVDEVVADLAVAREEEAMVDEGGEDGEEGRGAAADTSGSSDTQRENSRFAWVRWQELELLGRQMEIRNVLQQPYDSRPVLETEMFHEATQRHLRLQLALLCVYEDNEAAARENERRRAAGMASADVAAGGEGGRGEGLEARR